MHIVRQKNGDTVSELLLFNFSRSFTNEERVSHFYSATANVDCSQSPIFTWDRLTVTAISIFKCTDGVNVGDYSSRRGGKPPPKPPPPHSSFDTHGWWQPVTQIARSRWSYGKIEDCEQSTANVKEILNYFRSKISLTLLGLHRMIKKKTLKPNTAGSHF